MVPLGCMSDSLFTHDIFLSHSAKDKAVVRPLAERLRVDGLRVWFDEWEIRPGDNIPLKIEEGLERSRNLVLCMSANAFDSDWAQLESQTFRFRDPLNRKRRLIPLRLDGSPIKGSLAQFRNIDWYSNPAEGYRLLLEACGVSVSTASIREDTEPYRNYIETSVQLQYDKVVAESSRGVRGGVEFSRDRRRALGVVGETIHIWEVATGKCLRVLGASELNRRASFIWHFRRLLNGYSRDAGVAWCPQERRVLGSVEYCLQIIDIETGSYLRELKGHTNWVDQLSWSPDGQYVSSASWDRTFRVWSVETGQCLHIFNARIGLLSSDNRLALSGGIDNAIQLWDVETERCMRVIEVPMEVCTLAWTGDCRHAMSGSVDGVLRWWDLETGECLAELTGHTGGVTRIELYADGRYALSSAYDGTARLWNVQTERCLRVFRGHSRFVTAVAWDIEHGQALSCDSEGRLNAWRLKKYLPTPES